jgi:hypothetical protein
MSREQKYSQLVTPFSYWHRKKHDFIAYLDIDQVSICPACAKPLFLADHIYNKENQFRGKSEFLNRPYKYLAKAAKLAFFTIWYTVDETTENRLITGFHIKNQLTNSPIKALTPDQMLHYLEWKVEQHIPDCTSKDYLLHRIMQDNEYNNDFVRRERYVQILLNRS